MAYDRIPLSALIKNPVVAEAFRRGESDNGAAFAIPAPKAPVLTGGEAKVLEAA
ncbi:hypothetical protein N5K21_26540 [Rhizobium pusense]|uniref:hypothetical protein n=1 Tax=Agrobacterium pusense TaxID=648995 RepID=UPI002448EEF2|nr:hypothetical protein [Agrobacterium pusense]MDH2092281.1 hypothetical protein [Agrobacterium pusense]